MGATHTVNSKEADPVEAIRSLTPPPDGTGHEGGADVVIDAVGRPETWKQAFYARDLAGTVVLVGVPTPDMKIPEIPLIDVFGRGGALKSSWYGDCLPSRDFPMLVDLYQQGRLDLDAFVTEEIGLGDVEAAFDKMHSGTVLRSRRGLLMTARVDHAVVSGTFSLDGETHEVDNNVWVIGDDEQCLVIDAPHDVDAILRLVGGRAVKAIVCTHAHDDHVRVAPALRVATGAPILLHPDDRPLWELTHGGDEEGAELWDVDLSDGMTLTIGGAAVTVIHTPGHAPGAVCLYVHDLGCVFTGDTLFEGGPGATGRSFSDSDLIVRSIRSKLFDLPDETVVHTGHGPDTTIGAEKANL